MGKASRTKVEVNRREKIAAQRAAARRAEQRRRILIAGGSILAVIVVVVAFIVIKANSSSSKPATTSSANGPTGSALASVVAKVASVPASTLNSVGDGGGAVTDTPQTIKGGGSALTSGGKPEMLYMGAEYCPYCAAERWAMIVALNRFGTFSGLATVHSGIKDGAGEAEPDPSTPTWTFANATYTSKYLTFTSVEMQTNIPDASNGSYTTLQTPTAAQNALITKLDAAPYTTEAGAIPFIDFGNKDLIIGASYNPGVLSGLSWSTIATDLSNPSSAVARAVDGTANYITAAICKMTGNQPASACTSVVQSLESKI
jgi:thiol-disulfide isomerase/thioredoxin